LEGVFDEVTEFAHGGDGRDVHHADKMGLRRLTFPEEILVILLRMLREKEQMLR
jgi:hypothetical protein